MQSATELPAITRETRCIRIPVAAKMCGVSPSTIRRMIENPKLDFPSIRFGGSVLVPLKLLDEWIARNARPRQEEEQP
jgi:excisionase family DNA binding protein